MPSTYTTLGIEKPATGEQTDTWGGTVNVNSDIITQAISGFATITLASAGSSGSPNTIAITDGATSNGRNACVEFDDASDLGATAYVQLTPNDASKVLYVRNSLSGSQDLIIFQGTYDANDAVTVSSGYDALVLFDGGGATAVTRSLVDKLNVTALAIGGTEITATAAELNYVDGVTSAIQSQLDNKASLDANNTFAENITVEKELNTAGVNEANNDLSGTTPSLDLSRYTSFAITTSGNTTFTFANPPASGQLCSFTLEVTAGGTHTLTYPSGVTWTDGSQPDDPADGETDVLVFTTRDGGTTYRGYQAGNAMS